SNSATDIFLYDRANNATELISHAFGAPTTTANGYSHDTTLSADGRYVVFRSTAGDLMGGGVSVFNPNYDNVYVYDRVANSCALVSHQFDSSKTGQNAQVSKVKISANGQTVIFTSSATNLSPNMPNEYVDHAYAYSVATGQVTLMDHAYANTSAPG